MTVSISLLSRMISAGWPLTCAGCSEASGAILPSPWATVSAPTTGASAACATPAPSLRRTTSGARTSSRRCRSPALIARWNASSACRIGHGSLQVASHIPNIGRSGRYQSGIIGPMAMTVRTDPEMEKALTALTEAEGASRQEIIRRAVLDRYERRGHLARVEASSDRMLKRWGDVLERLGRA